MYKTPINIVKNRAYLELRGKLSETDLQTWADDAVVQFRRLLTGFSVVSDIPDCEPANEAGRQIIQTLQRTAKEKGMGEVVRITKGANPITANQWQRSSRAVGYTAGEAATVAEADALLDQASPGQEGHA